MEWIAKRIANFLLHFGWAVTGQGCGGPGDCLCQCNGLARFMEGMGNLSNGFGWNPEREADDYEAKWWHAVDHPNTWDHVIGAIYRVCHRAAESLNKQFDGRLL